MCNDGTALPNESGKLRDQATACLVLHHYSLRHPIGFLKLQKWAKVDTCFLLVKPTKPTKEILHYYDPDFVPKIISYFFQKANIAKIMVNVQKRLNFQWAIPYSALCLWFKL